jgi:hypothetical protein
MRHTPTPPRMIAGHEYEDSVWEGFLEHVDADQGHWLGVFRECAISEKRALAPLLCNFAILQTLRRRDYTALHEVLVRAHSARLPDHTLRTRATEVLLALGDAMSLLDEP